MRRPASASSRPEPSVRNSANSDASVDCQNCGEPVGTFEVNPSPPVAKPPQDSPDAVVDSSAPEEDDTAELFIRATRLPARQKRRDSPASMRDQLDRDSGAAFGDDDLRAGRLVRLDTADETMRGVQTAPSATR